MAADPSIAEFVRRWEQSGAAERANYQLFLGELCDLLGVGRPEPSRADAGQNSYVFDHPVIYNDGFDHQSTNWIDLYKRGCFVLEAKQGSDREKPAGEALGLPRASRRGTAVRGTRGWDSAMIEAKGQAERYARALPPSDGWPPFLVVVDVGHSIETYADFTKSGKTYVAFPDARSHRISLADLARDEVRERLRLVWTDPLALDPGRRSAKVTREVAERLAKLARSLEATGHAPEAVAQFLMRCLFTMFAEDVELIPGHAFTDLLRSRRGKVESFPAMVGSLWTAMDRGEYHPLLERKLPRFNGQLFASAEAPPLTDPQLELLIEAASADWRDVEPAIFGTLLERALDPVERHKLGAHYTPRAYVERLVLPTIVEPLREEWADAQAAALVRQNEGKPAEARDEVRAFLRKLCDTIVLDPACGTGNFLYVALEHMKRLEGEVRDALARLGEEQAVFEGAGLTVDPHQFLGIEINPRAAAIAELVLWIGHLQWHFRTVGKKLPAEPILHAYHNIECRDAVLAYDRKEPVLDEHGQPVTRWDGRTMKKHPVTGEDVPDETARMQAFSYKNPRKSNWPHSNFIVGNPPYLGARRIRLALGDDYVETLRRIYQDVPETCDYVMYWWHKAAESIELSGLEAFGLITTNSIVQSYSRILIERHLRHANGIAISFAIPDHPWVEASDGAAVRVAMTVGKPKSKFSGDASLLHVIEEGGDTPDVKLEKLAVKTINSSLGANQSVHEVVSLNANEGMCYQGIVPAGDGFKIRAESLKALGIDSCELPQIVKKYIIGRDLVQKNDEKYIIDFFGFSELDVRERWPALYQHLLDRVYPERKQNNRAVYRDRWWIFAEPRPAMRNALSGLKRFIVTPYTAKFRPFMFVDSGTIPDAMAYAVPSDDALLLGVLSSRIHVKWALSAGGRLGVGNDPRYTSKTIFAPFPFPIGAEKYGVRELGESLDSHRKRQQGLFPDLTITDMYNVLEKLRSGEPLTAKEKVTHEQGLVSILKQIHDDLDAAVFDAYGWPRDLPDEAILERLVALNAERAAEEARGLVRWLRPEFQDPRGKSAAPVQPRLAIVEADPEPAGPAAKSGKAKAKKAPWPATLAEQVQAVRSALAARPVAVTPEALAKTFLRARVDRVAEVLKTLETLGLARVLDDGRYLRA